MERAWASRDLSDTGSLNLIEHVGLGLPRLVGGVAHRVPVLVGWCVACCESSEQGPDSLRVTSLGKVNQNSPLKDKQDLSG